MQGRAPGTAQVGHALTDCMPVLKDPGKSRDEAQEGATFITIPTMHSLGSQRCQPFPEGPGDNQVE